MIEIRKPVSPERRLRAAMTRAMASTSATRPSAIKPSHSRMAGEQQSKAKRMKRLVDTLERSMVVGCNPRRFIGGFAERLHTGQVSRRDLALEKIFAQAGIPTAMGAALSARTGSTPQA